jgi:hypothetical protein
MLLPQTISRVGFLFLNLPNHLVERFFRTRQHEAREKFVVAVFVEPSGLETRHEARQGESIDGELRYRFVGACVGLVIEYMDRAVARLQEMVTA